MRKMEFLGLLLIIMFQTKTEDNNLVIINNKSNEERIKVIDCLIQNSDYIKESEHFLTNIGSDYKDLDSSVFTEQKNIYFQFTREQKKAVEQFLVTRSSNAANIINFNEKAFEQELYLLQILSSQTYLRIQQSKEKPTTLDRMFICYPLSLAKIITLTGYKNRVLAPRSKDILNCFSTYKISHKLANTILKEFRSRIK